MSGVYQIPQLFWGTMIRSIVIGAASAVAIVSSANAADLYKASPAGGYKDSGYVPVDTWTGFYLGVNGGYGWSTDNSKLQGDAYCCQVENIKSLVVVAPSAPNRVTFSSEGGFGGGQIGYNFQRDRLVFGIEADIQGSGIEGNGKLSLPYGGEARAHSELDWFGMVGGRLGYLFDNTLVYFKGGFAFGGVKDSVTATAYYGSPVTVSKDETRTGHSLGGGIEHKINPAWSLKAEYQYIDLGSSKLQAEASSDYPCYATGNLNAEHAYHTVRVGLNYHVLPSYEPLK
jgi:outer membrane immunogenic protein